MPVHVCCVASSWHAALLCTDVDCVSIRIGHSVSHQLSATEPGEQSMKFKSICKHFCVAQSVCEVIGCIIDCSADAGMVLRVFSLSLDSADVPQLACTRSYAGVIPGSPSHCRRDLTWLVMQGRHVIKAGLVSRAGSSRVVRPMYSRVVRPFYSPAEQALRRWLMSRSAAAQYKVTVSSRQNSMQLSIMHVCARDFEILHCFCASYVDHHW